MFRGSTEIVPSQSRAGRQPGLHDLRGQQRNGLAESLFREVQHSLILLHRADG